jgi:hypothetical protein
MGRCSLSRDAANAREREDPTIQRRAVAVRGSGEAAVAVLEGGAPRLIASANAAEERLLGPLQTPQHVLRDLGLDLTLDWASGFAVRRLIGVVMVVERDSATFPSGLALFQGDVVECATTPQDGIQRPLLFRRWIEPTRVGFAYTLSVHARAFQLSGEDLAFLVDSS